VNGGQSGELGEESVGLGVATVVDQDDGAKAGCDEGEHQWNECGFRLPCGDQDSYAL